MEETMHHILFYRYRCLLLLAFCLAACSCDKGPKTSATDDSAYNYSTDDIDGISLSGPGDHNNSVAPPVRPKKQDSQFSGFGASMCCIGGIPSEWQPGMWVKVVWLRDQHPYDSENRTGAKWFHATAQIPPYKRPADFIVKFLPGDRIRLHVMSNDRRPDGTYERSSTPPADNDPYIVQGIPDDKLNAELAEEIAWYAKERANEERARKAAGTQKEGGQP